MSSTMIPLINAFISSTTKDLSYYREAALEVINELNDYFEGELLIKARSMNEELLDGERRTPVRLSRDYVSKADWIILIVAWNYGFVPDPEPEPNGQTYAWEPCSVTEWEYRQAVEVCKPRKPCFVFMAGDPTDNPLNYRALEEKIEPIDLSEWRDKASEKMKEFRSTLRQADLKLFKNVEKFSGLLKESLKGRAWNLLRSPKGSDIDWMLIRTGLRDPVSDCITTVGMLATLKRLHDRLHKIRKRSISPWHKEVLDVWQQGETCPVTASDAFTAGRIEMSELNGEIKTLYGSLNSTLQKSLDAIPRVLDHFTKVKFKEFERAEFQRCVEQYASRVQKAFTACNGEMAVAAAILATQHDGMTKKARDAEQTSGLDAYWQDLLREAISNSESLHRQLQAVLAQHGNWQKRHNLLEQVDSSIGSQAFESQIFSVVDDGQDYWALLNSPDLCFDDQLLESPAVLKSNMKRTLSRLIEEYRAIDEKALRIVFEQSDVAQDFTSWRMNRINERLSLAYEPMRKAFDDLFFAVDTGTLAIVAKCEQRTKDFENSLRDMADKKQ